MPRPQNEEMNQRWIAAVESLGLGVAENAVYQGRGAIIQALGPFMDERLGHTMLPTGGGNTFDSVDASREPDCLIFSVGRSGYIAKPLTLTVEVFAQDPLQSFLLLELSDLALTDVYEGDDAEYHRNRGKEEVLELPDGQYLDRDFWDAGHIGHTESGDEIPLPMGSRLVVRWLRGKMLVVATGSIWNQIPSTYDGRHSAMTATEIRTVIEEVMRLQQDD